MNIGLVDVDGHNFPNFALMRLSAYNKANERNRRGVMTRCWQARCSPSHLTMITGYWMQGK